MTRQEFYQARRLVRTFAALCREALAADAAGDFTLVRHVSRWMAAEIAPISERLETVRDFRPGAGLTTQIGMIRALPDQRAQRISYVRMARYYRKPCRLPA